MPRVTALRAERRGRVAVELDGAPWRVLPVDVVARGELALGAELDRPALRLLRRELRRHEALTAAARTLRHRELSRGALTARLERGGTSPRAAEDAVAVLERAGLVDDTRVAAARAEALAERGYGDAAIRDDLERRGIAGEDVAAALAALAPEAERARRVMTGRGATPKTYAYLARRGFSEETLEAVVAEAGAEELR